MPPQADIIQKRSETRTVPVKAVIAIDAETRLVSLPPLTPEYLQQDLVPFLIGLDRLNKALLRCLGRQVSEVSLVSLRQLTPVEINAKGLAKETLETVREEVIPWRREHAQRMAELEERERKAAAEAQEAKTQEAREDAESKRIKNQKDRFELGKAKLDFAIDLAKKLAPSASPRELMAASLEINSATDLLTGTQLTIAPARKDTPPRVLEGRKPRKHENPIARDK
jgi:hypothetical protein